MSKLWQTQGKILRAKWVSRCPSNHSPLAAACTTCAGQPWTKVRGVKHSKDRSHKSLAPDTCNNFESI